MKDATAKEPGPAPHENPVKDPEQWVTKDEPMTGAQRSYLETLAQEAGEEVPENLSKAHASELIVRFQSESGRGVKQIDTNDPRD